MTGDRHTPRTRGWDGCTCQSGRDYDGSEFGPCEYCEREYDKAREQAALMRDAARWRVSRVRYLRWMDYPHGYFCISDPDHGVYSVGIQPHPVTAKTSVNGCILARGLNEGAAIDSMFLVLDSFVESGSILPEEIEAPRALAASARAESWGISE